MPSESPPYILEKLDFVQWLKETQSSLVTKSPAGYLRRALEEDYQPPPAYKSPAQRQAEAGQKARQLELDQQERREAEEQFLKTKERARQALAKEHPPEQIPGTKLTTERAWQMALERLKQAMSGPNYATWLSDTVLISCDRSRALIAAPSGYVADWLRSRFSALIGKELAVVAGFRPQQIDYLAVSELMLPAADSPEVTDSSPPGS